MAAPTPVSAYLHSATMVKAGVYLLARLTPALGGTELWIWVLVPVGGFTMLLGSVWAMRQTDLKLMLAQTTVMALGLMTMLLGVGTPAAIVAAMTFLLVHAFYKAGLFLAVGMIEKGAGSRDYPGGRRARPRDAADRGGDRAGGAVDGRAAAALRLHRQGADLRGDRPRAGLAGAGDGGGARRQRADGRLRRRWWRCGRSSARPRRQPQGPAGGPGLGALARAGDPGRRSGSSAGSLPGADRAALVAPMVLAVVGRADGGPPRALARDRARRCC